MKRKTKKHILTLLIICNLAFIWGNSAMTAQESGDLSGSLLQDLLALFPFLAGENAHYVLRKLAHFSEFAALGLLSGARRRMDAKLTAPFFLFGLAPACIDETIQLVVPGRASSLIDVWIDAAGFAFGCLITLGFAIITRKIQKNHTGGFKK